MELRIKQLVRALNQWRHVLNSLFVIPNSKRRGFTLLLAALIASVVLSLAASIFSIAQKQVMLSSLGRDSQFAFYAADTGAECALYWDIRHPSFGTSTPPTTPTCDGTTLNATCSGSGCGIAAPYTMTFQIDLFVNGDGILGTPDDAGYCAQVTVTKSATNPYTVIHADGYSNSCETISSASRSLQRSVELRY